MNKAPNNHVRLIILSKGKILTVVKERPSGTLYLLPGGQVEYLETMAECVVRELQEECGVQASDISDVHLVRVHEHCWEMKDALYHEVQFFCRCTINGFDSDKPVAGMEPGLNFVWVDLADVKTLNFYPEICRDELVDWLAKAAPESAFFSSSLAHERSAA